MEGRVEICLNNSYGTVCDDRWDVLDARVACRQLGLPDNSKHHATYGRGKFYALHVLHADVVPLRNSFFGGGLGEIFLDDVLCTGNESRLSDCSAEQLHDCDHSEDAGVRCGSELK